MPEIKKIFFVKNGKSLEDWIKSDTRGDYEKFLLTLIEKYWRDFIIMISSLFCVFYKNNCIVFIFSSDCSIQGQINALFNYNQRYFEMSFDFEFFDFSQSFLVRFRITINSC